MSALNFWLSESRALIATDTEAHVIGNASPLQVTKAVHLAHAQVVIAGRGSTHAFGAVVGALLQTPSMRDFDSVRVHLPAFLAAAFDQLDPQLVRGCAVAGIAPARACAQEICAVGWSHHARAMAAVRYERHGPGAFTLMTDLTGATEDHGHASPYPEGMSPLDVDGMGSPEGMRALIAEQSVRVRGLPGVPPVGGVATVLELTPTGCTAHLLDLHPVRSPAPMVIDGRKPQLPE